MIASADRRLEDVERDADAPGARVVVGVGAYDGARHLQRALREQQHDPQALARDRLLGDGHQQALAAEVLDVAGATGARRPVE